MSDDLRLKTWPRPDAVELRAVRALGGRVDTSAAGIDLLIAAGYGEVPRDVLRARVRADACGTLPATVETD